MSDFRAILSPRISIRRPCSFCESNLVDVIGDRFDFYIVTSNRDFLKKNHMTALRQDGMWLDKLRFFIWNGSFGPRSGASAGC